MDRGAIERKTAEVAHKKLKLEMKRGSILNRLEGYQLPKLKFKLKLKMTCFPSPPFPS